MDINFVSSDPLYIECLRDFFERTSVITVVNSTMDKIPLKNTVFVCPCDCFCSMNDMIGKVYDELVFPYIRVCAGQKLKELETKTLLGRKYLPIGSAMVIPADYSENCYLLFVPIVFMKNQDIKQTRNIYHAFMAMMCLFKRWHNGSIEKIMFPCVEEYVRPGSFAEQVYGAMVDFTFLLYLPKAKYNKTDFMAYIPDCEERNKEQPDYYENREIKTIVNVKKR